MPGESGPIRPDELDGLFSPLWLDQPCALAVSGGSDSTALMVLFADWLQQRAADARKHDAAQHIVLTVDHRLRPESAAETRVVAEHAASLGLSHATLIWKGKKPRTGIQSAAREARYRLMREHLRTLKIGTLLTAHTLDDQAETLLMRLARGSGLDGLTAIAPSAPLTGSDNGGACPIVIARPLLGLPKARLRATLQARGLTWIEDPSNHVTAFERTRLRTARADLDALGLTDDMLALSARRLRRARGALDAVVESYCAEAASIVDADPCGFFTLNRENWRRTPDEIALRIIGRCIAAAGGSGKPVPLGKLEPVVAALRAPGEQPASWTLARCLVRKSLRTIEIEREPGRLPLPALAIDAGENVLWDGRFLLGVAKTFEGPVEARALGADGLLELRRLRHPVKTLRPLRLSPSFWREGQLLAAPAAAFWASADLKRQLSAKFAGLRCYFAGSGGSDGHDCEAF